MKKLKITSITQAGVALVALTALIGLSPVAKAVVVAPGNTGVAITTGTFTAGSTTYVAVGNPLGPVALTGGFTGSFSQSVYTETLAYGKPSLDFYYRFTISGPVGAGVLNSAALSFSNLFGSYVTDVNFLNAGAMASAFTATGDAIFNTPGGTLIAPTTVDRASLTPGVINFNFGNGVIPTQTTFVLQIKTDAANAALTGMFNLQGTGISQSPAFEPIGPPVPEPTTALFGCALIGSVALARKRNRSQITA